MLMGCAWWEIAPEKNCSVSRYTKRKKTPVCILHVNQNASKNSVVTEFQNPLDFSGQALISLSVSFIKVSSLFPEGFSMGKKGVVCHVVSETHWDRAWYLPFERFHVRLVDMIDHLLTVLAHPDFRHFVFDGQMVPIEDYLDVKPHRRKDIEQFARRGKLILGPCYVLPDEFLVSPESHVRNLLIGHSMAAEFGPVQKVGYFPDSFGHVSQMPQILNGFGIDSFIFMRGMGDEGDELGLEFWWDSPAGMGRVLACHQVNAYCNALMLGIPYTEQDLYPVNYEDALKKAECEADNLLKFGGVPILLFNNGLDHYHAQETIPRVIAYVNKHSDRLRLIHSTFEKFAHDIRTVRGNSLKSYCGELHGGRYQWVLSGTFSSRLYLKQANFEAQATLERKVEPLAVFAWLLGAAYPSDFLLYAWKTLLKNHPHDDICGCSVDAVHRDMVNRFEHVMQISDGLSKNALDIIMSAVKFKGEEAGTPILVLNTRPTVRNGEARIDIAIPGEPYRGCELEVVDFKGNVCPARIERLFKFKEPKFWGEREMEFVSVLFLAQALPPVGYRAYYLRKIQGKIRTAIRVSARAIENEFVRITFNPDGTLNILDKESGLKLKNAHYFEDCADAGDEYDFSEVGGDKALTSKKFKADIQTEIIGGYKAVGRISLHWSLPEALAENRHARSNRMVSLPIVYEVILVAGERRIEFRTTIENRVKDHRLRAVFPTPIKTEIISVESKFDVIDRPIVQPTPRHKWSQMPVNTHHQENFASISDGDVGATFFTKGLCEYEASPEKMGVAYHLTLLRCVGWLSRGDMDSRYDNAGPSVTSPEAQYQGQHIFEYALLLHKGGWQEAGVQKSAYEYATPLVSYAFYHQVRNWKGEALLPEEAGFFELSPESLILTAMKKVEGRQTLLLRLYNPTNHKVNGSLDFAFDLGEAWRVRLDETRQSPLTIRHGHIVRFLIKPKEILTLEAVLSV
jgi:alpha-mannosidase